MLESTTSNKDSKGDLVELTGLWENTTKNGEKYLSGTMGRARVLIFANKYKDNDRAPAYRLYVARNRPQEDRMDDASAAVAPSNHKPAPSAVPTQEDDIPF